MTTTYPKCGNNDTECCFMLCPYCYKPEYCVLASEENEMCDHSLRLPDGKCMLCPEYCNGQGAIYLPNVGKWDKTFNIDYQYVKQQRMIDCPHEILALRNLMRLTLFRIELVEPDGYEDPGVIQQFAAPTKFGEWKWNWTEGELKEMEEEYGSSIEYCNWTTEQMWEIMKWCNEKLGQPEINDQPFDNHGDGFGDKDLQNEMELHE